MSLIFACSLAQSKACADERVPSVEQLALAIDSATGLLAVEQKKEFLGARSCAAAACHGGIDPDPRFPLSRRNEYVHWLDKDPHARGYQTLQNDLSTAILERLARPTDDDTNRATNRAKRLANCFGCHNPQPAPAQRAVTFFERDGVSCEICHGPAEKWIGPHATESWPGLKAAGEAATLGFINTKDITIRARTCAACHVGSPDREVNHDLIAAGHPALKFELTAYHAMLPKHWRDVKDPQETPPREIKLWTAGQVACADAAIALLKWRAQRAEDEHPDAVWPEFAEYDCYACHHDLVHPSWRQAVSTSSVPLGMPAWGSWYFSHLKQPTGKSLQDLADQMQRSFLPDKTAIIEAASLVQLLAPAIDATVREPASWDDATQSYLALVAREQAQRDAGVSSSDSVTVAIETLRQQLAFPAGHDSPQRLFDPDDTSGSREQVYQSLLDLMKQLQTRGEE